MFCTNCGAANGESARYCANCGAALQRIETPTVDVPQPPPSGGTQNGKHVLLGCLTLCVFGLLLVAAVAGIGSLVGGGGSSNGGGGSSNGGEVAQSKSDGSEPLPEYEVMSVDEPPSEIKDENGNRVPAKLLVVHTKSESEDDFERIAEDIRDTSHSEQEIVHLTFGNMFEKNSEVDNFAVILRTERAAQALGQEFSDGGIVVNPEVAEQASQDQYAAEDGGAASDGSGDAKQSQEPKEPQTVEEKIRFEVEKTFRPYKKDIEDIGVQQDASGCRNVAVSFKATPNAWSAGWSIDGIELQMQDIYKALYADEELGDEVCNVTTNASGRLTDDYGNVSTEKIYSTSMDAATSESVNWKNDYAVNFNNVWTVDYIHPAVEQQKAKEKVEQAVDCAQDDGIFDVDALCP